MEAQKRVENMENDKILMDLMFYMYSILKKYSGKTSNPMDILNEMNLIEDNVLGSNKGLFILTFEFYLQMKCQDQNPRNAFDYVTQKAIKNQRVIDYFAKRSKEKGITTIVQELRNLVALAQKNELNLENFFALSYLFYLGADKRLTPFMIENVYNLFDYLDEHLHNLYSPDFEEQKEDNTIDAKTMKINWM